MNIFDLLSLLHKVKGGNGQWTALCPAHDDHNPSLSIGLGEDGRILMTCHRGCSLRDITASLGIEVSDLFPDQPDPQLGRKSPARWTNPSDKSKAKSFPDWFKRNVPPPLYGMDYICHYTYVGTDSDPVLLKARYQKPSGKKHFTWWTWDGMWYSGRGDFPHMLFAPRGLHTGGEPLYITEGEKDTMSVCERLDMFCASSEHGASAKWYEEYTQQILDAGVTTVFILMDHDDAGAKYGSNAATALTSAGIEVFCLDLSHVWPEIPEKADITDMLDSLGTEETAHRLVALTAITDPWVPEKSPAISDNLTFAPFDPFPDRPKRPVGLPPFPVAMMPDVLQAMATEVARFVKAPVDLAASTALAVVSLATQGRFVIEPQQGWQEPLSIYIMAVAASGERKSSILRPFRKPFDAYEMQENKTRGEERVKNEQLISVLERRLKKSEGKASSAKETDYPSAMDDVYQLRSQLEEAKQKTPKNLSLLTDDVTPERLSMLMHENHGRMGILTDEAGSFLGTVGGRYSSNGAGNIDLVLQSFSGSPVRVDRISRDPVRIDNPFLTLLLMAQPSVLSSVMSNTEFLERGLMARILICYPEPMGKCGYRSPPVSTATREAYQTLITAMLNLDDTDAPRVITLSPEADHAAEAFFDEAQNGMLEARSAGDHALEAWMSRIQGQAMRIAGIFHVCQTLDAADSIPVSLETMENAITIARYYIAHAKSIYAAYAGSTVSSAARYIWKRMSGTGKEQLAVREVYHLCKNKTGLHTRAALDAPLAELVRRGYINISKSESGNLGGRPSEIVTLRPFDLT